jgi:hypothetical protein
LAGQAGLAGLRQRLSSHLSGLDSDYYAGGSSTGAALKMILIKPIGKNENDLDNQIGLPDFWFSEVK